MGGGLWVLEISYRCRRIRNCWSGKNDGGVYMEQYRREGEWFVVGE